MKLNVSPCLWYVDFMDQFYSTLESVNAVKIGVWPRSIDSPTKTVLFLHTADRCEHFSNDGHVRR